MSTFPSGPGSAPPGAPPAPAPAPAPAGGDPPAPPPGYWDTAVPGEGMPDVYKPFAGKTPNEIAASHRELRSLSGTQGSRIKDLEGNLKTAQEALTAATDGQTLNEDQQRQEQTRELWRQSVHSYWKDEGGDETLIQQLADATGLSREDVLDVHENFLSKRKVFLAKANSDYPKIDVPAIEGWIQAGESGISDGMMQAFYYLADEGYTGWLEVVQKKYEAFIEKGGRPTGQAAGGERHPLSRGKPPAAEAAGYGSRQEYQEDYNNAVSSGSDEEKSRVLAKLEASDPAKW